MEYRFLGRTGLKVSALSFGTVTFGGEGVFSVTGKTQIAEARSLVDRCIDVGINLFDTADVYSYGAAEEMLGRALGKKRADVLVTTKVHCRVGDGPNDVGLSRHHIVEACDASLRRLGTDHIDIYHVHGVDSHTAAEETLGALDSLVTAGKVRYLGCSNYSAWQLMKALGLSAQLSLERFCVLQAYYSLVARELEWELIPLCVDQDLGLLVWSPLAAGFLTGKYRELAELPAGARLSNGWSVGVIDAQAFRIVDKLKELADQRGVSVAQVALNYLLRKRGVTSLIIGARNQDQLEDNLGALSWSLDDQELIELDAASERPLPYPYWHQQSVGEERCTDWMDRPPATTASLE